MTIRIIPRLDIKGPNLVKGIHLEGLRVLGKPEHFAQYYYKSGADELIYMDVVASLYGRNNILDIVTKTSEKIFIPLTVGGGIRTLEDIHNALNAGADKIALNTAAIHKPELISEAARKFGSSTIIISIEAIKKNGIYEVYTDNGREPTNINALDWAKQVSELGAGEIIITSIDKEGTGKGFDLELTKKISKHVPIPVIACGGAGNPNDILEVIKSGKADAVSISSILHYESFSKFEYESGDFNNEGNTDFLFTGNINKKISTSTIYQIKSLLSDNQIESRILKKV